MKDAIKIISNDVFNNLVLISVLALLVKFVFGSLTPFVWHLRFLLIPLIIFGTVRLMTE